MNGVSRYRIGLAILSLSIILLVALWFLYMQLTSPVIQTIRLTNLSYATYSPNGSWLITTQGGANSREAFPEVTVWEANSRRREVDLRIGGFTTRGASFSADSQYLITQPADSQLRIWETNQWSYVGEIHLQGLLCDMAYHPNNHQAAVATCGPADGGIFIVDIVLQEVRETLAEYSNSDNSQLAYHPSGNVIVYSYTTAANATTITLLDQTLSEIFVIDQPGTITDIAWSIDGHLLATGDDNGNLVIWTLASNELEQVESIRQDGTINSIAFSPDGNYLAAGGTQPTTLYELPMGQQLVKQGHTGVRSIQFSPDGRTLAVVTQNPRAELSILDTSKLIQ